MIQWFPRLCNPLIQENYVFSKPLPLTTVELQKTANRMLHIPSDVIMTVSVNIYPILLELPILIMIS